MVDTTESTPFRGVVTSNRQRKKAVKGTEVEVRVIKEGQFGWFALALKDGEDKPVFLSLANIDRIGDVSAERKAELDTERKAWRNATNEMLKLSAIAWQNAKAIGIDTQFVSIHAGRAIRQRVFLPKSQIKDGSAPRWLVAAKVEEMLEKFSLEGITERSGFSVEDLLADATVFTTSTPKQILLVRENEALSA